METSFPVGADRNKARGWPHPWSLPLPGSLHSSQAVGSSLKTPPRGLYTFRPLCPESAFSSLSRLPITADIFTMDHSPHPLLPPPPSTPLPPHRPHCCVSNQLSTLPPRGLCTCLRTALTEHSPTRYLHGFPPSFFPFPFILFECTAWQVGFKLPNQGLNPHPLHWQGRLNHWASRGVPPTS